MIRDRGNTRCGRATLGLCALPFLMQACAAEIGDSSEDAGHGEALSLGARGPEVIEVQRYLARYGYLPNDALAVEYPSLQPIVADAPEPGLYDEPTQLAVRELQARNHIEVTGAVDEATRAVIDAPRCGVPDGIAFDPDSKFSLFATTWSDRTISWRAYNPGNNFGTMGWSGHAGHDALLTVARHAFAEWSKETDLIFHEITSGTPQIEIRWGALDKQGGDLARGGMIGNTKGRITVDWDEPSLSVASPPPAGSQDLFAVMLHEVGHALGLDHSSVAQRPVMFPSNQGLRQLRSDDVVAISTKYDRWHVRPGLLNDVAAGQDGVVWGIGVDQGRPNNFGIHHYNSATGSWSGVSGGGLARRIAVGTDGRPWVATSEGGIFSHSANPNEGGWTHAPALCGFDLSWGADGSLWFVTCTGDPSGGLGGHRVGRLTVVAAGSEVVIGIQEIPDATNAIRIAVGPDGMPWIVTTTGRVLKRTSANPLLGSWLHVSGIAASDIAVSPDGAVFATGGFGNAGRMYVRNEQPAKTDNPTVSAQARWIELARPSSGVVPGHVTASSRFAWFVGANNAVYQQTGQP